MIGPPLTGEESDAIRRLETIADRSWPAEETTRGDDWEARFSNGMHRRLDSATVWSAADLAATVDSLEAWYALRGQSPIFKLTDASATGLDGYLATRGYVPDARVTIMTAEVGTADPATHPQSVDLTGQASTEWMEAFADMSGYGSHRRRLLPAILSRIEPATAYAARRDAGSIVSVGMAVAVDDHAGLFEMATHPDHRGRGFAAEVRDALLGWARRRAAAVAFLQVLEGNVPAEHLYRGAGFTPRYRYWYRVRPDRLSTTPR